MADVLQMWDGDIQTVFSIDDFIQLVDEYMGMDARRYLESYLDDSDGALEYAEDLEKERDGWRDHHKEVVKEIREQSEKLAGLISEKELDRREISNACGKIGILTWKEMNTA
jgi:hypothetical protein